MRGPNDVAHDPQPGDRYMFDQGVRPGEYDEVLAVAGDRYLSVKMVRRDGDTNVRANVRTVSRDYWACGLDRGYVAGGCS